MNTNNKQNLNIMFPNSKVKTQVVTQNKKVFCIGDDADSPHPKVFLSVKKGEARCPYCGIIFATNNE